MQDSSFGQTRSLKASHLLHSSLRSRLKRSDSGSSGERTFRKSNEDIHKKIKRAAERKKTQALFSAQSKPCFRNHSGSTSSSHSSLFHDYGISASQAINMIQKKHPKLLKQHFGPGNSLTAHQL